MTLRAISQAALPDFPKFQNPGETCELALISHQADPFI